MTLFSNKNVIPPNYSHVIETSVHTWTPALTGTLTFQIVFTRIAATTFSRVPASNIQNILSVSRLPFINLSQWCPEANSVFRPQRSVSGLDVFNTVALYHLERSGVKHNAEVRGIALGVTPGAKAVLCTHTCTHAEALYAFMTCLYHYPNKGVCQVWNWVVRWFYVCHDHP